MKKVHRTRWGAFALAAVLATSALATVPASAAGQKSVSGLDKMAKAELSSETKAKLDVISKAEEQAAGLSFVKEFTMEQPVALNSLDLSVCKGAGTFSFDNPAFVPDKGVTTCQLVFTPSNPNAFHYEDIIGWDAKTKTIRRYVQVICISLKLAEEEQAKAEAMVTPTITVMPDSEATPVPDEVEPTLQVTAVPEATKTPEEAGLLGSVEKAETPDATKVPEATATPVVTKMPEATKTPEVTKGPESEKSSEIIELQKESSDSKVTVSPEVTVTPTVTNIPEVTATPVPEVTAPIKQGTSAENAVQVVVKDAAVVELEKSIAELSDTVADDIQLKAVLDVSRIYNTLTTEQKLMMDSASSKKLAGLQQAAAVYNHTDKGVTVSGNIPWYVALRVELDNDTETYAATGLETIVPYEISLWDMMNDTAYMLTGGEKATLTMKVPEDLHLYDGLKVVHYMDENHYEFIELRIDGDKMSFSTSTFSPFNVAGSNVLVGGTNDKKPSVSTGDSSNNKAEDKPADKPANTKKPTNNTNSDKSTGKNNSTSKKPTNATVAAKTGDEAQISKFFMMGIGAVVLITLSVVLMVYNKKEKNK